MRIDRRSVPPSLKPSPFSFVLSFSLVLAACKSRPVEQTTGYRSDAAARRGIVKTGKEGMTFEADETLAKTAADASQNAVKVAKQNFDVVLDWSDSSVGDLERVLDAYYRAKLDAGMDEGAMSKLGALFGSYVGEVFRRNHGGQWGFVTQDAGRFPGIRADRSGQIFWPWGRVQNRIGNGPRDNVFDYYRIIVHDDVFK